MSIVHTVTLLAIAPPFADHLLITRPIAVQKVARDCALFIGYSWRHVGPNRGGRYNAISGDKGCPDKTYSGGLWRPPPLPTNGRLHLTPASRTPSADAKRSESER